jgi:GNAT superfamily N-acetyltransferase
MDDDRHHSLELRPFRHDDGPAVMSFVRTDEDAAAWASLEEVPDEALLARWHADPDVHAFTLFVDGVPAGYGEVWVDRAEDETELARIVIDPARRGRGLGRQLTRLLAAEAARHGLEEMWLRVVPGTLPPFRVTALRASSGSPPSWRPGSTSASGGRTSGCTSGDAQPSRRATSPGAGKRPVSRFENTVTPSTITSNWDSAPASTAASTPCSAFSSDATRAASSS